MKVFLDKMVIVLKGVELVLLKGVVMFGYELFVVLELNFFGFLWELIIL